MAPQSTLIDLSYFFFPSIEPVGYFTMKKHLWGTFADCCLESFVATRQQKIQLLTAFYLQAYLFICLFNVIVYLGIQVFILFLYNFIILFIYLFIYF